MKNKFTTYLLVAFAMTLFLSSCKKIDDLYKETDKQTSPLFPDSQGIPSDFNWSMVKSVDVRIAVDDRFNGQYFYKVELFDNDPLLGSGANLLGAGQAKQGQDFVNQIVVPTALEYVYLKTTSPVGIPAVSMISVKDVSKATVSSTTRAQVNTRETISVLSGGNLRAGTSGTSTYTTTSAPTITVPAGAIELVGNTSYTAVNNQAYVVKTGTTFTGSVNLNNNTSGAKVYVVGTWDRSSESSTETNIGASNNIGNAIYVLDGGTLNFDKLAQNNQGFFENYGTVTVSNLKISNGALYKNYGNLTLKNATVNNGSFTNYGTANIQSWTSSSESTVIRNEGTLTIVTASMSNHKMEVVCHTTIQTLNAGQSTFNIFEGALLNVKQFGTDSQNRGGNKFNLSPSAILDITEKAMFGSGNKIIGPTVSGTAKALARLKKVELGTQWEAIEYSNNLEVACSDHTPHTEPWQKYYIISSPAAMVPYDQSTVVITGTPCNAGGNNDAGAGTNPDNQTVTEVNLGTYSYAFEDNWPSFGDYDMNDFVTDMTITKFQNAANKVTKVELKAKLRSVGAVKRLAAAVQLDDVPAANVKSVTYSRSDLVRSSLQLTPTGIEVGQTYAVVPICDDAHTAFGVSDVQFISTQNGNFSPVDAVITIEFNTPLEHFTYTALNVFIINFLQNAGGRNEIHLVGYKPTDKMNKSLVAYQTDNVGQLSIGDPFRSHDGYPWGLSIPVSFGYPIEGRNISQAYPRFREWAESGGVRQTDWYIK